MWGCLGCVVGLGLVCVFWGVRGGCRVWGGLGLGAGIVGGWEWWQFLWRLGVGAGVGGGKEWVQVLVGVRSGCRWWWGKGGGAGVGGGGVGAGVGGG